MTSPSFDILSEKTDIFRNYFLEASAGSGKTFAIENFFVRLILESQTFDFRSILVMTFTKKGCHDLKSRIRSHLLKVINSLKKGAFPFPYLAMWRGKEELAIDKAAKALLFFEEAEIYTLHGFCYALLRQMGHITSIRIPREEEVAPIFRRHLDDLSSISPEEVKRLSSVPGLTDELIAKALRKRPWQRRKPFLQVVTELAFEKEKLSCDMEALMERMDLRTLKEPLLRRFVDCFAAKVEEDPFSKEEWDSIQKMCLPKAIKKGAGPLVLRNYPDFFERIERILFPYIEEKRSLSHLLSHFFSEVQGRLRPLKEEEKWFSYDDLVEKVDEILEDGEVLAKVRERYRFVIVDEFQDTDLLQWQIIKKIFHHEKANMVLVGDPKQAIYSFRGADVYTYLEAKKELGEEAFQTLSYNFRSREKLVSAQNRLLEGDFLSLPKWGESLAFRPAIAGKKESSFLEDGKGALHWIFPEGPLESAKLDNFAIPAIAREILRYENSKMTLAILVDTRSEAEKVASGLKSFGIASTLMVKNEEEDKGLGDTLLYFLMEAIERPYDLGAIKRVAWLIYGFSDEELLLLEDPETRGSIVSIFQHLKRTQDFSKELFFEELLDSSLLEGQKSLRARLSTSEAGEIIKKELDYLRNKKEETSLGEEEFYRMTPKEQMIPGKVAILTLHSSKGLEFDLVFATGILAGRKEGVYLENLDLPEKIRKEELFQERLRLLYVGLTRAKERLYIPIYKSRLVSPFRALLEQKGIPFEKEALIAYCEKNSLSYEIFSEPPEKKVYQKENSILPPEIPPFVEKRIPYLSFTILKAEVAPKVVRKGEAGGTYLGILLHEILETLPFSTDRELLMERVKDRLSLTPYSERVEEIVGWLAKALESSFLPGGRKLIDCEAEKILREAPFLYAEEAALFRGSVDLVGEIEGNYFIVDWKSHAVEEDEDLEALLAAGGYFKQAEIYKQALRKYIQTDQEIAFIFYFLRSGRWFRC